MAVVRKIKNRIIHTKFKDMYIFKFQENRMLNTRSVTLENQIWIVWEVLSYFPTIRLIPRRS